MEAYQVRLMRDYAIEQDKLRWRLDLKLDASRPPVIADYLAEIGEPIPKIIAKLFRSLADHFDPESIDPER